MSHAFREGDFVESLEGLIFDVKGLIHPPDRVVAFVRYIPDIEGSRVRDGKRFRKIYELDDRYRFLASHYPNYLVHDPIFDEDLNEVPTSRLLKSYRPLEKTHALVLSSTRTALEQKTLEMIGTLSSSSGVSIEDFGISGSILVELAGATSDMDIVIYGSEKCKAVRKSLQKLMTEREVFQPYDESTILGLYKARHCETGISFGDYVQSEAKKDIQGRFRSTDFFVRYVKDRFELEETYGSTIYGKVGFGKIEGTVSDDREAIFTPCEYPLENVRIVEGPKVEPFTEIVSFRGQFCEQATMGERVVAQGKIERKITGDNVSYRLILGNTRCDYMIVTTQ